MRNSSTLTWPSPFWRNVFTSTFIILFAAIGSIFAQQPTQECLSLAIPDPPEGGPVLTPQKTVVGNDGFTYLFSTYSYLDNGYYYNANRIAKISPLDEIEWMASYPDDTYGGLGLSFKGRTSGIFVFTGTGGLTKFDGTGAKVFSVPFLNNVNDVVEDINGNVYVGGFVYGATYSETNYVVYKYDKSANLQWTSTSKRSGNSSIVALIVDTNGDIIAAGSVGSPSDIFLMKFNSLGQVQFDKTITATGNDYPLALQSATNAFYLLTSKYSSIYQSYLSKYTLTGNVTWSQELAMAGLSLASTELTLDPSERLIVTLNAYNPSTYLYTAEIRQLNSAGSQVWKSTSTTTNYYGQTRVNASSNIYTTRTDYSTYNTYLKKISSSGASLWEVATSSFNGQYDVNAAGTIYLANVSPCADDVVKLSECTTLSVTNQPQPTDGCLGGTASFQTSVSGRGLTYQWFKGSTEVFDDARISGANTATLTINGVVETDAGDYKCFLIDNCRKTLYTAAAKLTIIQKPVITQQPVPVTACESSSVQLVTNASGGKSLKYQWKQNGTNVADGGGISGSKTRTITFNPLALTHAGTYTCEVTDDCGSLIYTSEAQLSVLATVKITKQPTPASAISGSEAVFIVEASGAALSYQWKKNNTNIAAATSSILKLAGVQCSDAGNYSCTVTASCGSASSTVAALSVADEISIVENPINKTVCKNESTSLSIKTSGSGIVYEWYKSNVKLSDGTDYSGTGTSTLTIKSVSDAQIGQYSCKAIPQCGTPVTSSASTVAFATAPAVTAQSGDQIACEGATVQLSVTTNDGPWSYQWFRDGVAITDNANIGGSRERILFLSNVLAQDGGTYTCKVVACNSTFVMSGEIQVDVNSLASVSSLPSISEICNGSDAQLTADVTGTVASYQWKRNGINLIESATISGTKTKLLSLSDVTVNDEAFYSCEIIGGCSEVLTTGATKLQVNMKPDLIPSGTPNCGDLINNLDAVVTDGNNLLGNYFFYYENSTTPLTVDQVSAAGIYTVIKTTAAGCTGTTEVELNCVITGTNPDLNEQFSVIPNPGNGIFQLATNEKQFGYAMFDSRGIKVLQGVSADKGDTTIDGSHLDSGLYMITIRTSSGLLRTLKLIILH